MARRKGRTLGRIHSVGAYALAAALLALPYWLDLPILMGSIAALAVATLAVLVRALIPERDAWRLLPRAPHTLAGVPLHTVLARSQVKRSR
jgi:branched-subunit amino acid ABC-type transport system permease component